MEQQRALVPEFDLKHIYYFKEEEGGDMFGLSEGWAHLYSVRKNKVLGRYTYTGLPNDRRYIAYVDRKAFVTNCTWALNFYNVDAKTNTESYGYTPFPGRKVARNLAKYFPTKEDCLNELQKQFREAFGNPQADIMEYQDEDKCFLWPGTHEKSDYIVLNINGVQFNLAHLLKYAIEGVLLHETDESGEFKIFPGRDRSDIDASHTCYRKSCIVAKRIVFETQAANNKRNFCSGILCDCGMAPPCFKGPYEALTGVKTLDMAPENTAERRKFRKILGKEREANRKNKVEFPLYTPYYYDDRHQPVFYGNTNRYAIPKELKEYYRKDFMRWGINCDSLSKNGTTIQEEKNKSQTSKNGFSRKRKWTHMTPEDFASTAFQPSVSLDQRIFTLPEEPSVTESVDQHTSNHASPDLPLIQTSRLVRNNNNNTNQNQNPVTNANSLVRASLLVCNNEDSMCDDDEELIE